jgi:hypothetical protein
MYAKAVDDPTLQFKAPRGTVTLRLNALPDWGEIPHGGIK